MNSLHFLFTKYLLREDEKTPIPAKLVKEIKDGIKTNVLEAF
jgi:hypothetical protein